MRIGIDIGGVNMRLGIVDGGKVYRKIVAPALANESKEVVLDNLVDSIAKIMNTNIRGIGIAVPSVVDAPRGIVNYATNIPSWRKVPLKDILERKFKIPVFVNNDSNCFAFGERYYGEGTGCKNIVCLTLGTGVGAGIVINNELYSGFNTAAGELGFLAYGETCFENYCSGKFFINNGVTAIDAADRARKGDKQMAALWKDYGRHVAYLIRAIIYTYDPQAVILGGGVSRAYDLFEEEMFANISNFSYLETLNRVKILVSKKEDVILLGAAALVV